MNVPGGGGDMGEVNLHVKVFIYLQHVEKNLPQC